VPSRPLTPQYIQSDATSIKLGLTQSDSDGGLLITHYVLQVSQLVVNDWREIVSYDGVSLIHTVTVQNDALVANQKYRFRIKAVNAYGSSEWSSTLALSVASLPSAPLPVIKLQ
jgi:hypothetical protein